MFFGVRSYAIFFIVFGVPFEFIFKYVGQVFPVEPGVEPYDWSPSKDVPYTIINVQPHGFEVG
jgi:hypothetical protein